MILIVNHRFQETYLYRYVNYNKIDADVISSGYMMVFKMASKMAAKQGS